MINTSLVYVLCKERRCSMKKKARWFLTAGLALAVAAILLIPAQRTIAHEASEQIEDRIIALHNAHRANAGLPALVESDRLNLAADIRADEIGVYFSHIRPNGTEWWTVDPELAYGENLAYGYQTADDAMNGWMYSAQHMYNVLNPDYRTLGVGVELIGGVWYYVAEFGY